MLGRVWPNPDNPYEPKWLPQDVEDALELMAEHQTLCSGCGHPRDETTALDDHGRPLHDWEVGSTVCQACEARRIEEDRIAADGPEGLRGRLFYTHRVDGDDA